MAKNAQLQQPHSIHFAQTLCKQVIKVSLPAARCQSSKLLHHSGRWYLIPIRRISPAMTSSIRSSSGAITNLLIIPQKQEGREGNRWEGRRMVSMRHNAPFLLFILSASISLLHAARSLVILRARELRGPRSLWQYCIQVAANNGGWPQRILGTGAQPSSPAGGSSMLNPSIHIGGLLRLTGAKATESRREGGTERIWWHNAIKFLPIDSPKIPYEKRGYQ